MPPITREDATAVQDRLDHENPCFGCGPGNEHGLRLKSYPREGTDGLEAAYRGPSHLAGSAGVLGGGPQATLVDCHGVWTATWHAVEGGEDPVPKYVTAALETAFTAPAPLEAPIRLLSEVREIDGRRVYVDVEVLDADGTVCTEAEVACHRLDQAWGANPL